MILDFFGRAICHQLDERSLYASGLALSVCARDTGIYIGIFSTLLYLHIFKRKTKLTIPTIKISFLLLLFMVPMMIDGLGSYTHLFQSNNVRRLISGICFGFVLPYFLYPLYLGRALAYSSVPVIQKKKDIWVPILCSSILGGLFYFGLLPYYFLNSLIIFTVIVWFSLCASFLIPFIRQTYFRGVLSILLSLFFLSSLSLLHAWLVQYL
ncbi:DUF2085 domain-containing protein [Neobacillus vireti]|uniref:DUF2085 domain-containing protein n=1 Tax=Neobacillus vireti TaxID=220686 RepID=UPI003B5882A5